MFSASWRCSIEAGGEVQVFWGRKYKKWKARRRIGCLIMPPYGHESWVMTERVRSQMQASEMRFWQKIKGLFDKLRNTAIRESLNIVSLLFRIVRPQLRWFGQVSRMPHERLPKQTLHDEVSGKMSVERPRTRWLDHIEDLGWNRLGHHLSEMQSVLVDREVWQLNLELLPQKFLRKCG